MDNILKHLRAICERHRLVSKKFDIAQFLEEFIPLAVDCGRLWADLNIAETAIIFTAPNAESYSLEHPRARTLLRAICPQLAFFAKAHGANDVNILGGHYEFYLMASNGKKSRIAIDFMNTSRAGCQWFRIASFATLANLGRT